MVQNNYLLSLTNVGIFWKGNFIGISRGETTIKVKTVPLNCNYAETPDEADANFITTLDCTAEIILAQQDAKKLFPADGKITSPRSGGKLQFAPENAGELKMLPFNGNYQYGYAMEQAVLSLNSEWLLNPDEGNNVRISFSTLKDSDTPALQFVEITPSDRQFAPITNIGDFGELEEMLILHISSTLRLIAGSEIFRFDGLLHPNALSCNMQSDYINNHQQYGVFKINCCFCKRGELFTAMQRVSRYLYGTEYIQFNTKNGTPCRLKVLSASREYENTQNIDGVKYYIGTVKISFELMN